MFSSSASKKTKGRGRNQELESLNGIGANKLRSAQNLSSHNRYHTHTITITLSHSHYHTHTTTITLSHSQILQCDSLVTDISQYITQPLTVIRRPRLDQTHIKEGEGVDPSYKCDSCAFVTIPLIAKARRMNEPAQKVNLAATLASWSEEELDLLAHCRAQRWSYARIQKRHFPRVS